MHQYEMPMQGNQTHGCTILLCVD